MADRVIPIKIESITLGGSQNDIRYKPANINEDALACRGIHFQTTTGNDSQVTIERSISGNALALTDGVVGTTSLLRLWSGRSWVKEAYTADANQVYFSINEAHVQYSDTVAINGLMLDEDNDYYWDDSWTLVFNVPCSAGDRITIKYQY